MIEYQILVRLNKTQIRKGKDKNIYGICQVCSDRYGQFCIEASSSNCRQKINVVFIFCKECHTALNDICTIFIYKKNTYSYEDTYHISENPVKIKCRWFYNKYYAEPIWRNK